MAVTFTKSDENVKLFEPEDKVVEVRVRRRTDTEVKKLPRILNHYRIFSYVMFSFCILMFIVYLSYAATIQFTAEFFIQYDPVYQLLVYNSYNLQCPFIGLLFVIIFTYHVKYKVHLEDGDFFGLIGVNLLFCMVMCYDGAGVHNLYLDRLDYVKNVTRHTEEFNPFETNELAWQYAWSTRPTCARVHAHSMLMMKEEEQKRKEAMEESHGPGFIVNNKERISSAWMFKGKLQSGPRSSLSTDGASLRHPNHTTLEDETIDQQTYQTACNFTSNSVKRLASRNWMKKMQRRFKCCGPRGRQDWEKYVYDTHTTCKSKGDPYLYNQSCAVPFSKHLADRFYTTVWFMFILAVAFMLIMITACLHFAAMKYEDRGIVKEYSLLNLAEPDNIQVVETFQPQSKIAKGLLASDPVRGILQASTIRAERSRRSTLASSFNPRFAFGAQSGAHSTVKNLTHSLLAFNKGTTKDRDDKPGMAAIKKHVAHSDRKN